MFYYFDPLYFWFALPGLILALFAQAKVKSNFSKYGKIINASGYTGADVAQLILRNNGITNVQIKRIQGNLTDNFNPTDNCIYLSDGVFGSNTIAAVGIAAHEAGHAVQHAQNYAPVKLRMALVPICNFGAGLSPFLIIVGYLMQMEVLLFLALGVFLLSVVFQLLTLPFEFDASARAMAAISQSGVLNSQEQQGARKVLSAAALTYVAALVQSLLIFLYYFVRFTGNRRD